MKRITLLLILMVGLFTIDSAYSQATQKLNFGFLGASYDIPVATDISIAPFASTDLNLNWLTIGVKGDYYFDNLIGMTEPWDFYAGANAGYGLRIGDDTESNGFDIGLQVGGRWFWSEKWGLYLEFGGGSLGASAGLGLSVFL